MTNQTEKPELESVIGDCAQSTCQGSVRYRPNESNDDEGYCDGCGQIYEVDFDSHDDEEADDQPVPPPPPPPPPPVAPAPPPLPLPPPPRKDLATQIDLPKSVGELQPIVPTKTGYQQSLSAKSAKNFDDHSSLGIPRWIRGARPWKFAHQLGETGNPYREDSNNRAIFSKYEGDGCTLADCVSMCWQDPNLSERMSFLLTVYEVTIHCLSAGLLVEESGSRIIKVCEGNPIPVKVT